MTLPQSVADAVEYCNQNGIDIPPDLYRRARSVGATKAASGIAPINAAYRDVITEALTTYFEGGSVTGPRNQFKRGVVDAFGGAFDLGWVDGGQEPPLDEAALEWYNARVNAEFANIDMLFAQIKDLRKDEEYDFFAFVTARADGYVSAVLAVYNAAVLFAKKNKMLTWRLGNTETHCATCLKLDGGRKRASWYINHNYIPRQPGASMDCGGYNCDCSIIDDDGKEVTL